MMERNDVGFALMGVMRPELVMKSIVPVVMAGVQGICGLIIDVIISTGINLKAKSYYRFDGYAHLSSDLACDLAKIFARMAIGIVGDTGVRANTQQPKLFVGHAASAARVMKPITKSIREANYLPGEQSFHDF